MKAVGMVGWQDAVEAGELRFPKCHQCATWNWYPLPRCRNCGGEEFDWVRVEPLGSIHSWTRVHRRFSQDHDIELPYTVGIIDIAGAPGVRLTCLKEGTVELPVGTPVELSLDRRPSGARWTYTGHQT